MKLTSLFGSHLPKSSGDSKHVECSLLKMADVSFSLERKTAASPRLWMSTETPRSDLSIGGDAWLLPRRLEWGEHWPYSILVRHLISMAGFSSNYHIDEEKFIEAPWDKRSHLFEYKTIASAGLQMKKLCLFPSLRGNSTKLRQSRMGE